MGKRPKEEQNEEIFYFGPGLKNDEIDEKFTKLYEKLQDYCKSIFELVESLCPKSEDQIRLALNIAETDGNVLQRLVAKECERRRELMRIKEQTPMPEVDLVIPVTSNEINHLIEGKKQLKTTD